jgi:hypothetical protein
MWVLVLMAIFVGPELDQNFYPVTRHTMSSYPSEAACKADQAAQTRTFYQSLPVKPAIFGGTCVQITNGAPV